MNHGKKTYGMEVDIHAFSISTVQGEWSTSKYRSLQPCEKSRLHSLSGCEEGITEIYHRLCCRPFRSLQSLYWATLAPYVPTIIQIWTVPKSQSTESHEAVALRLPFFHKLCKYFEYPNTAHMLTKHIWITRTMRDSLRTTEHRQRSRTICVTNCDKYKVRGTAFRPPEVTEN